jgi:hypothetical protein
MTEKLSGTFTARPGPELHQLMTVAAKRDSVSLNEWSTDLFKRALGQPGTIPRTLEDLIKAKSLDKRDLKKLQQTGVTIVYGSVGSGRSTFIRALLRSSHDRGIKTAAIVPFRQEWEHLGINLIIDYLDLQAHVQSYGRGIGEPEFYHELTDYLRRSRELGLVEAAVMMFSPDTNAQRAGQLGSYLLSETRKRGPRNTLRVIFEVHAPNKTDALRGLSSYGVDIVEEDFIRTVYAHRDHSTGMVTYHVDSVDYYNHGLPYLIEKPIVDIITTCRESSEWPELSDIAIAPDKRPTLTIKGERKTPKIFSQVTREQIEAFLNSLWRTDATAERDYKKHGQRTLSIRGKDIGDLRIHVSRKRGEDTLLIRLLPS